MLGSSKFSSVTGVSLRTCGVMILLARDRASCMVESWSMWMIGSSDCDSLLKLLKSGIDACWNSRATYVRGLVKVSRSLENLWSANSSLTKKLTWVHCTFQVLTAHTFPMTGSNVHQMRGATTNKNIWILCLHWEAKKLFFLIMELVLSTLRLTVLAQGILSALKFS